MSKIFHRPPSQPSSSLVTIALVTIAGLLAICLPDVFTIFPINFSALVLFSCTSLILLFFIITLIRRQHFYYNFSPLTPILSLLFLSTLAVVIIKFPFYPEASLLSLAGLILCFTTLAIINSSLIKINNSQLIVPIILTISTISALFNLIIFIQFLFPTFPQIFTLPTHPLLHLSLLIIGFATIFAQFFKKGKFKPSHLIFFLPLIVLGLSANLNLQFRTPQSSAPSLNDSLTLVQSFTPTTLLLGASTQDYAHLYHTLQAPTSTPSPHQAFNFPLTLLTMFGIFPLIFWLALIIHTLILCLSHTQPHRQLYFILFISFIIQFFTPIYVFILLLQTILIAIATKKTKATIFTLQFTRLKNFLHPQKTSRQTISVLIFACFLLLLNAIWILKLTQTYLGHHYYQQALKENQDFTTIYRHSLTAVQTAPFIEVFNRLAAVTSLEQMIAQLTSQPPTDSANPELFYQAVSYIQKAIDLEPQSAQNYLALANIYQEINPYLDETSQVQNKAQIAPAYIQAILHQPKNPELFLALANFYQEQGQVDEALNLYQQTLTLAPNLPLAHYQLATLHEQTGDLTQAKNSYIDTFNLLDPLSSNYQENYDHLREKITTLPSLP